jgi:hypothetical protein
MSQAAQPDPRPRPDLRIGNILIAAGLVSEAALNDALETSIASDVPVGKNLVSGGLLEERLLQAAIQVQSMLRDGILELEIGVQTLSMMASQALTLEEALARANYVHETDMCTNRLGELLCLSGIATRAKLDEAIAVSHRTSLPLGRILIALGIVWDELLEKALTVQQAVRDGSVSRQDAIAFLEREFEKPIPWKPIA